MPNISVRFGLFILVILCSACAKQLQPQEVATQFWTAIERSDAKGVKKHVTAADAAALGSLDDVLPISDPTFARTVIDSNVATVDTTVTINGDKPLNFPLKTYLVLEDEQWKVDYNKTIDAIASAGKLASVLNKVQEFGSALRDGIDKSMSDFEQALPQIEQEISKIESQIKQHVPELRERIEKFAREIERSLNHNPQNTTPESPESSRKI